MKVKLEDTMRPHTHFLRQFRQIPEHDYARRLTLLHEQIVHRSPGEMIRLLRRIEKDNLLENNRWIAREIIDAVLECRFLEESNLNAVLEYIHYYEHPNDLNFDGFKQVIAQSRCSESFLVKIIENWEKFLFCHLAEDAWEQLKIRRISKETLSHICEVTEGLFEINSDCTERLTNWRP